MLTAPVRVLLADASRLLIEPLAVKLNADEDIVVVGMATDSDGLLRKGSQFRPDVAVVDVDLPGRGPFEIAKTFSSEEFPAKFIFLSDNPSDILIEQALLVGARGFLLKTERPSSLIEGIKLVQQGETYFSLQVGDRLHYDPIRKRYKLNTGGHLSSLTTCQLEVLRHLAKGRTVKEIARVLELSPKSIDCHKYRLMKKLKIHDRVELARYAFREGLTNP